LLKFGEPSSPKSLGPKKIKKKSEKKKVSKISPESGKISPNSGEISPDSLFIVRWNHCLWHFGKKNLKVPTLRDFETLGGYIVNF
jgi:hypothetical protein